jgi:hypothetical protein
MEGFESTSLPSTFSGVVDTIMRVIRSSWSTHTSRAASSRTRTSFAGTRSHPLPASLNRKEARDVGFKSRMEMTIEERWTTQKVVQRPSQMTKVKGLS